VHGENLGDFSLPGLLNAELETRHLPLAQRLRNNIVSPYGLAAISYAFFLFACLIPPSLYSQYMIEKDLMFLDPATILFYTLCVASFVAGARLVSWMFPSSFVDRDIKLRISPTFFLMVPLTIGIIAAIVTIFILIAFHPDIIFLLLTQQGGEVKENVLFEIATSVYLAPYVLTAIIWWAYWRSFDLGLQGWRGGLVKSTLVVAVLSVISAATLILSRGVLMMVVCGLAILYVARRSAKKPVSFKFVFGTGAAIAICAALLFFAFSFLRGTQSFNDQVPQLLGYTVGSYNRLAAIVNGNLRYPFAGRGLYLSSFVAFNHTLNRVVPISSVMDWPDQLEVWGSEFGAVSRAGLDGSLILSGTFGYIFSDLGWVLSPPFVFGYGLLYGIVWNWIKRGNILGIVLYPSFGFCALLWIGTNSLLDSPQVLLLIAAIVLAFYELVLVKSNVVTVRATQG
jgi:hypothetical protein